MMLRQKTGTDFLHRAASTWPEFRSERRPTQVALPAVSSQGDAAQRGGRVCRLVGVSRAHDYQAPESGSLVSGASQDQTGTWLSRSLPRPTLAGQRAQNGKNGQT
jgi:hypothetical protein